MTHCLPVKYLYQLTALIQQEYGVEIKDYWQNQGLFIPEDTAEFVDDHTFESACKMALDCIDDPALGFKFGNTITIINLGPLGAAMMSCATITDIFDLALEYSNVSIPYDIEITELKNYLKISPIIRETHSDYAQFHLLVFSVGIVKFLNEIFNFIPEGIKVEFPFSEPKAEFLKTYQHYLPIVIEFNKTNTAFYIPNIYLKSPLPRHDEVSKKLFLGICQDIQHKLLRREKFGENITKLLDA